MAVAAPLTDSPAAQFFIGVHAEAFLVVEKSVPAVQAAHTRLFEEDGAAV